MSMKGLALAVASIVLIACNGDSEVASEPTAASQSSPPPVATTAPAPSPTPSPAPESAPALDYESRLSGLEDAFHAMVDSYNEPCGHITRATWPRSSWPKAPTMRDWRLRRPWRKQMSRSSTGT